MVEVPVNCPLQYVVHLVVYCPHGECDPTQLHDRCKEEQGLADTLDVLITWLSFHMNFATHLRPFLSPDCAAQLIDPHEIYQTVYRRFASQRGNVVAVWSPD